MGKKSYQSASKYARQSNRAKRKGARKPRAQGNANIASQRVNTAEASPSQVAQPKPVTRARMGAAVTTSTYAYVASDLKRILIITAAMFVMLIVLAIVFGQ